MTINAPAFCLITFRVIYLPSFTLVFCGCQCDLVSFYLIAYLVYVETIPVYAEQEACVPCPYLFTTFPPLHLRTSPHSVKYSLQLPALKRSEIYSEPDPNQPNPPQSHASLPAYPPAMAPNTRPPQTGLNPTYRNATKARCEQSDFLFK